MIKYNCNQYVRYSQLFGVIVILLGLSVRTDAQTIDTLSQTQDMLTRQIEDLDDVNEDSDILDDMEYLLANPININKGTIEDLQEIPGVDAIIAKEIILYRTNNGKFESITDLQKIPIISLQLYQQIVPYVTVIGDKRGKVKKANEPAFRFSGNIRSRMQTDIQDRAGFSNNTFDGNKAKVYMQQKYRFGDHVRFGLINEKDPGEKKYFDYVNGYVEYTSTLLDDMIDFKTIVGSFKASYGQALVQWTGMSFGKSSEPVFSVKKTGRGIQPYLSSDENQFYRGVGMSSLLNLTNTKLDVFYSDRDYDGKYNSRYIYDGSDQLTDYYLSFDYSGLHRTASELSKKDQVNLKTVGFDLTQFISNYGKISLTSVQVQTGAYPDTVSLSSQTVKKNFSDISNLKPNNKEMATSLNWDFIFGTYNFYGEAAKSSNNSNAFLTGIIFKPIRSLAYSVNYRSFDSHYRSFYARPFKEKSSQPNNEVGFYQGLNIKVNNFSIYGYYDFYRFNQATTTSSLPSNGIDRLLGVDYQITRKYSISVQSKIETFAANGTAYDEMLRATLVETDIKTESIKFVFNASLTNKLAMQTKVNYRAYTSGQIPKTIGYSISEIVKYSMRDLTLNGYYHIFDTDNFNNRIYVYESDLPGLISSGLLYDKGYRIALVAKYSWLKWLDLSTKISHTQYLNKTVISSGTSAIQGNKLTQFGFQLDFTM